MAKNLKLKISIKWSAMSAWKGERKMIRLTDKVRLVVEKEVINKDGDKLTLKPGDEGQVISRRSNNIVVAINGKKFGLHTDEVIKVRGNQDEG